MNIRISSQDLAYELGLMGRVINKRPVIPVLGTVLVEARETGGLRLSATDTEIALVSVCDAAVIKAGSAAIPASRLHDLSKTFKADLELQYEDGAAPGVRLASGGFRGRLSTFPVADFPTLPADREGSIAVPVPQLRELVVRTRFACKDGDSRYFLGGVQFDVAGKDMTMVGTDGHRLAIAHAGLENAVDQDVSMLIPSKSLDALLPLLETDAEQVHLATGGNHLFFEVGDRLLVSRRIDGKFPEYKRMIPKPYETSMDVSRAAMVESLRRVRMVSDPTRKMVVMSFAEGLLGISAQTPDVGTADESIETKYTGAAVRAAVNGDYMIDFLEAAGTDTVRIQIKNDANALLLSAQGAAFDYLYVVMPMRQ